MLRFVIAGTLVLAGLSAVPSAAAAVTVDTSTWYVLVNQYSGKALDVATRGTAADPDEKVTSTADGAQATQYTRDGTASQQWKFVDAGNGYYRLGNRYSGKVLDVPAFSTADGTVLDQWSDSNDTNEQFTVQPSAGGSVRLTNRNSGKAVSGKTPATADGTQVVQSTDTDAVQQRWVLVPANLVDTGIWYELVNVNSGKALSVLPDSTPDDGIDQDRLDGAKIIQSTGEQRLTQQWQLVGTGDGYYRLLNKKSDKALDVPAFSTADGTVLDQWSDGNGTNQQFELRISADGAFRLLSRNSGKAVSVKSSSTSDGADVVQSTDADGAGQQWRLVPAKASTSYVLVNQNSGKALEIYNAATTDGAKAAQWSRNDGAWQRWQFVDAGNGYYKLSNKNSGKVLD
ncbi:MAG TPA: RICIN domain-containing protein, partial [Kribbellaceae bacterium]